MLLNCLLTCFQLLLPWKFRSSPPETLEGPQNFRIVELQESEIWGSPKNHPKNPDLFRLKFDTQTEGCQVKPYALQCTGVGKMSEAQGAAAG